MAEAADNPNSPQPEPNRPASEDPPQETAANPAEAAASSPAPDAVPFAAAAPGDASSTNPPEGPAAADTKPAGRIRRHPHDRRHRRRQHAGQSPEAAPENSAAPAVADAAKRREAKRNIRQAGTPAASPATGEWFQDLRLERVRMEIEEVWDAGRLLYRWRGEAGEAPPLREPKSLDRRAALEIYHWMLLARGLDEYLERLEAQGQISGPVFPLRGQEASAMAPARALGPRDWLAPRRRNQASALARGLRPREIFRSYLHPGPPAGDWSLRVLPPLGDAGEMLPLLNGLCLGERMQGREIAALGWIGDGGQSGGAFHEALNLAAAQRLGLVLLVENNLWAQATPLRRQTPVRDLALRARAYGIPATIVDGSDCFQLHYAVRQAVERAHHGGGPTLIEAKLSRLRGHTTRDAAAYVPANLLAHGRRRDPLLRLENWLLQKNWLREAERLAGQREISASLEREFALAQSSPAPEPASMYCEGCHQPAPRIAPMPLSSRLEARTGAHVPQAKQGEAE